MTHTDNLELRQWLTNHIDWSTASRPLLLKNFFPSDFENYIAILWTPGIIDNFPFNKIVLQHDTIEQTNKNIEIWRKFNVLNDRKDNVYRHTTFKEISERFNLIYDRNIVYKVDWSTRGVTTLLSKTKTVLNSLINSLTDNEELNLFIEDYWRWASVYSLLLVDKEVTYKVTVDEFIKFMDNTFYDANAYLFPNDKSWSLINLEDLNFSIIAFNNQHAETISNLKLADTFKLNPTDKMFD